MMGNAETNVWPSMGACAATVYEPEDDSRLSPVYALLRRVSMIDYPGRLCRVLFLAGCNMRCVFCHNQELIHPQKERLSWERLEEILLSSRENWVDSVTVTGGEPTLNSRLRELILRLKNLGFKVKLDTNGTAPERLASLLPMLDWVAMDYKAPLERYRLMTGSPQLELENISRSVAILRDWEGPYELRTTVVPGLHTEQDIEQICRELAGVRRYALQAYVPPRDEAEGVQLPAGRTPIKLLRRFYELASPHFPETVLRGG
ncbi:anaerobic ribonucleoside-triphosphate reductase activating protein [bacterium]|nr:anaerobic ribonucleoside-triphosphate reductase activating protein [bacterium]